MFEPIILIFIFNFLYISQKWDLTLDLKTFNIFLVFSAAKVLIPEWKGGIEKHFANTLPPIRRCAYKAPNSADGTVREKCGMNFPLFFTPFFRVYAKRLGVEAHMVFLIAIVETTITRRTKWKSQILISTRWDATKAHRLCSRKILRWRPAFSPQSPRYSITVIARKSKSAGMGLQR